MEKEEKAADETNFTSRDGSVDHRALLTGLMQKFLGKSLDYARMSGMSDRSFTQYQRSLKDDFYQILGFGLKILEENGLLKKEDSSSD